MSKYTAEDFEKARFAEHRRGGTATRNDYKKHWVVRSDFPPMPDEEMADEGWTPVREANGRRDRNTYVDHIAEQDRIIRDRNATIATLTHERDVLAYELADAQAPLSLDSLAAAYEAAEVPTGDTPIREGDVMIYPEMGGYVVRPAARRGGAWWFDARVMFRAPQVHMPEWQDLADVLADMGHTSPTGHARDLYERGVRVTGGEES